MAPTQQDNTIKSFFVQARSILGRAIPGMMTGLLLYLRWMISILFLDQLGGLAFAGGSLAIGFANITGYSVLSGLAMGMEPICGKAFGAGRHSLIGLAMQRTVLLLLCASLPIALLWIYMEPLLLLCGQDESISSTTQSYLLFSLPDLLFQSFLHPLRIYLRSQSINLPLAICAALSIALHFPINYFLVSVLHFGIKGVALASIWANLNLLCFLLIYVCYSKIHEHTGGFALSAESFKGWRPLLSHSISSCVSVCLDLWWYVTMILIRGFLLNPQATYASMGILIQTIFLIYIFPSSLSFGVSTRVGIVCSFVLGFLPLSFAVLVRNVWARMFTSDATIVGLTASVLPFGPAGMPVAFWAGLDFRGLWIGLFSPQACYESRAATDAPDATGAVVSRASSTARSGHETQRNVHARSLAVGDGGAVDAVDLEAGVREDPDEDADGGVVELGA